ncbi:MAG: glycosyl transferase family 4 [Nanoarchaeota archaeon]
MVDYRIIIPILASFFITLFVIPVWIKKAKQINLLWDDMHKIHSKKVPGSGGLIVFLGFIFGVLIFIAYRVFYLKTQDFLIEILASLLLVSFLAGIGLIDDLLGWQKGGLSKRSRIIMIALASISLMVINAGKSDIVIPIIGQINFGILYPLVLIPVGIIGAATTFNFLAGYNGLEAGQGALIIFALSVVAFFTGNSWLAVLGLCMTAALVAFLLYNFYPAKVFPGDVITYSIGGLIAVVAILGNFEKIAIFFFLPYIIEFVLKARGKLTKQSFGKPQKDGSLDLRYNKIYGLEHLSIYLMKKANIKATEKKVVYSIWIFQILIILVGFIIFRKGIF